MEDILLDEENNEPKGEVPYAALLPFVCTLLMINLVMGASKLTKGAEFSIVLLVYLIVVPIISSAVGLLIGVRPYGGLRFWSTLDEKRPNREYNYTVNFISICNYGIACETQKRPAFNQPFRCV